MSVARARAAPVSAIVAMVMVVLPWPTSAQSRLITRIDTTAATVGDRIGLSLTVEHPEGTHVEWPDSIDVAPFEVLEARSRPTASAPTGLRSGAVLTLTAFELGELEIPSFEVRVVGAEGVAGAAGTVEVLATDRFAVEIVSVGTDESGDIRDIRGPLSIPLSPFRIALVLLVTALALALATWLWRRARRPRAAAAPRPARVEPTRPAHERALEALAALEASPLLERGQVKEYHIEVSAILRRYVEERFKVEALELTTREVIEGLVRAGLDDPFTDGLRTFLERCDLVKFAKVRPDPGQSRETLELGRRIVLESISSDPGGDEVARPDHAAVDASTDNRNVAVGQTTDEPEAA